MTAMQPPPVIPKATPPDRPSRRPERVRLGYFGEARRLPRWRGPAERIIFSVLAVGILLAAVIA